MVKAVRRWAAGGAGREEHVSKILYMVGCTPRMLKFSVDVVSWQSWTPREMLPASSGKFYKLAPCLTKKAVQSWCSWDSSKEGCAVQVMLCTFYVAVLC